MKQIEPEVGMPATMHVGSDDYGQTVVLVSPNKKKLWVTPGEWKDRTLTIYMKAFSLRKTGRWVEAGAKEHNGRWLSLGYRETHRDPTF